MNQPIKVYQNNQPNIDIGTKTPNITLSPAMKRRLKPIPDNQGLIQLTQTRKTSLADSPSTKMRIKSLKQEIPASDSFKNDPSPNQIKRTPSKSSIDGLRFFNNKQATQDDQLKLPNLKDSSPTRKIGSPVKYQQFIKPGTQIIKQPLNFTEATNSAQKIEQRDLTEQISYNKAKPYQLDGSPNPRAHRSLGVIDQVKPNSGQAHLRSASNPNLSLKPLMTDQNERSNNIIKYIVQKYLNIWIKRSQAGQNGNKQTKINQDSVFYVSNFGGIKNRYYMGVCDGHGTYGHLVSQIIKKILPTNLENCLSNFSVKANLSNQDLGPKEESLVLKSFAQSFQKTSREINSCGVDVTFSGTTCVTVLVSGEHLWCANIGDSRAVLYFMKDGLWNIQPLSNDHKPDNPVEMKRILNSKGRVEPFMAPDGSPIGPHRVWLQHEQAPGLAMSRSFGDYVASTVGVVSDPEVTYFKVEFDQGFLVVASDGVWEFLSNERVCEFLQSTENVTIQQLEVMANNIVKESTRQWQLEDEVIDDISVIIGYVSQSV